MKKLFLTLLFATAAVASFAQGVKFHHGSWEELLADAKKQKKPFYVDFWATWCGPCIMMNKTTFQDPQVAAYSNSNFIAAKFDVDKEGQSLAQKYSIRAMPTVVFFDAEGKELFRQVGFVQGPEFLELLKKANNKGGGGSGKGGKETGSNAKPGKPTETPATFDDYLKLKTPVIEQVEGRAFAAVAEFKQQAVDLGKARNDFDYEDLKKKPLLS